MNFELIGPDAVRERLPMTAAIDVLEGFFADRGATQAPARMHLSPPGGTDLLLMPAWDGRSIGVKLVTVNPSARPLVNGVYCLFDEQQVPRAIIDAAALTALRTAAVSGVATRLLSRQDPSRLVVFGAGVQARAHIEAMRAVRPIEEVVVVSPSGATDLAATVGGRVGTPEDVAGADIVCTCTTSPIPVFDGSMLARGAHVNAVGAYKTDHRELDDAVMARALVVVEDRSVAAEAGDILLARPPTTIVADLFEVATGGSPRSGPDDITVFKSVGVAYEDLVVARAIVG